MNELRRQFSNVVHLVPDGQSHALCGVGAGKSGWIKQRSLHPDLHPCPKCERLANPPQAEVRELTEEDIPL